ncbi:MAG TPA: PLD nuclease N-terminal domain-containing protein [Geobacteraceae bacterium]
MHELGIIGLVGVALSIVLGVAVFALWLWTLVDILKSEFIGNNKLVWLVAVILVPVIGVILYLVMGRGQKSPGSGA